MTRRNGPADEIIRALGSAAVRTLVRRGAEHLAGHVTGSPALIGAVAARLYEGEHPSRTFGTLPEDEKGLWLRRARTSIEAIRDLVR